MFLHLLRRDPRDMPVWDVEDCLAYLTALATPPPANQ